MSALHFSSRARDEHGQTTVELALLLPLLLLILLAMVDFGKAFNYWNDANQIAAEGARHAAVNRNPGGDSLQGWLQQQGTTDELRNGGGDAVSSPMQVCIEFPLGQDVGDPVKVTVSADYNWLPFLGIFSTSGGPDATTVAGSATMRLEQPPTNLEEGCA